MSAHARIAGFHALVAIVCVLAVLGFIVWAAIQGGGPRVAPLGVPGTTSAGGGASAADGGPAGADSNRLGETSADGGAGPNARSGTQSAESASLAAALDPQPEVVIGHLVFTLPGGVQSPEALALLSRLGGPDPTIRGVLPADPTLDDLVLQRLLRGVPGADVQGVMGVITVGGQRAGIMVSREQTDPLTGLAAGVESIIIEGTATVLEGERIAFAAALRGEQDSSVLEVVGRRVGVAIGQTREVRQAVLLEPGQAVAIRLPGKELAVAFVQVRVRRPAPAPAPSGTDGDAGDGEQAPPTGEPVEPSRTPENEGWSV